MNSFGVIRNYFTSIVWNEYIVKTEITRTLIGAGIKVVLLVIHADLLWFILSTLFDTVLLASGYIVSYRRKIDRISDWTFDKATALYLIKQSFPLLLSGAAVVVYQKIDQVMLGNMIDKEAVGYYSVAGKFTEICLFIPTILSQTITPILVKAYHDNMDDYQRKAKSFMNITIWGTIIICIVICLISHPLIKYTFGIEYTAAVTLLQIMIFKTIGYASAQITGALIVIEKKQKYVVIRNIIGCIVCIGLNLLLIPRYGVTGAAMASVITAICTGYLSHVFIPTYRSYFYTQTYSFLLGWKDIVVNMLNKLKK
jgi:O-antigen/teichoic acid export membrane protein